MHRQATVGQGWRQLPPRAELIACPVGGGEQQVTVGDMTRPARRRPAITVPPA
jgi:hypothetical protein